jgi:phospholipid/cholesterol/gamma-HCH transport system substrate-binding protein
MRYKFNPFERAVGIFLSSAILGSMTFAIAIAVKKNWFEEKNHYYALAKTADGIREGAAVQISGLKVGKIEVVDLKEDGQIKVKFSVLKKYEKTIPQDSMVSFVRPYILGEKIINISLGKKDIAFMKNEALFATAESLDVIDIMTGDRAREMLTKTHAILDHVEQVVMIGKEIASQVGDKKKLAKTMDNIALASYSLRKMLPHVMEKTPEMSQNVATIVANLSSLTSSLKDLEPIISEVAKTLPTGSKKAIEALNESVVILRAMQNSFLLKGSVADVRKEEAKKEEEAKRKPASEEISNDKK